MKKRFIIFIVSLVFFKAYSSTSTGWKNVETFSNDNISLKLQSYVDELDESSRDSLQTRVEREKKNADTQKKEFLSKRSQYNHFLSDKQRKVNSYLEDLNIIKKDITFKKSEIYNINNMIEAETDNSSIYTKTISEAKNELKRKLSKESFKIVIASETGYTRNDKLKEVKNNIIKSAARFAVQEVNGIEIISKTLVNNNITASDIITSMEKGNAISIETQFIDHSKNNQIYSLIKFDIYPLDEKITMNETEINYEERIRHYKLLSNEARKLITLFNKDDKKIVKNNSKLNLETLNRIKMHIDDYNNVFKKNNTRNVNSQKNIELLNQKLEIPQKDLVRLEEELEEKKFKYDKIKKDYENLFVKYNDFLENEEHLIVINIPKYADEDASVNDVYKTIIRECIAKFNNQTFETYTKRETKVTNYMISNDALSEQHKKAIIKKVNIISFYRKQNESNVQYELAVAFKFKFKKHTAGENNITITSNPEDNFAPVYTNESIDNSNNNLVNEYYEMEEIITQNTTDKNFLKADFELFSLFSDNKENINSERYNNSVLNCSVDYGVSTIKFNSIVSDSTVSNRNSNLNYYKIAIENHSFKLNEPNHLFSSLYILNANNDISNLTEFGLGVGGEISFSNFRVFSFLYEGDAGLYLGEDISGISLNGKIGLKAYITDAISFVAGCNRSKYFNRDFSDNDNELNKYELEGNFGFYFSLNYYFRIVKKNQNGENQYYAF